jgi:hypothetical protein
MDEYINLNDLVGKSFPLLDGTSANIYMLFDAKPVPFFLVKRVGGSTLVSLNVFELFEILEANKVKDFNS